MYAINLFDAKTMRLAIENYEILATQEEAVAFVERTRDYFASVGWIARINGVQV